MKIGESARKIGQKYDLYASVMIAQVYLESASGQSQLAPGTELQFIWDKKELIMETLPLW